MKKRDHTAEGMALYLIINGGFLVMLEHIDKENIWLAIFGLFLVLLGHAIYWIKSEEE